MGLQGPTAYNLGAYNIGPRICDLADHSLDWGATVWGLTVWGPTIWGPTISVHGFGTALAGNILNIGLERPWQTPTHVHAKVVLGYQKQRNMGERPGENAQAKAKC